MRTIIIGSLALNFVLLTTLAYVSVRKPVAPPPPGTSAPAQPAVITPRLERKQIRSIAAVHDDEAFDWQQVESPDFKQYMANLRAIGCPEETIRDLIVAEINKMLAPRFAALAAATQKFNYWRNRSKSKDVLATQLRALQGEKKALLREL